MDILLPAIRRPLPLMKVKKATVYVPTPQEKALSPRQIPLHPLDDFMYIGDTAKATFTESVIYLQDLHYTLPDFTNNEQKLIEEFCTLQRLYFSVAGVLAPLWTPNYSVDDYFQTMILAIHNIDKTL